jgi:hypothetical protein
VNDPERKATSYRESKSLNTTFALAADLVGLDFNGLKKFCAVLGIDGPSDSYDTVYQQEIHAKLCARITEQFANNHKFAHTSRNSDGSKPLQISISGDGTYQKRGDRSRGYSSKLGITIIFDADTGLPLDYHINSKFCHTCTQKRKDFATEEELVAWAEQDSHECAKNFASASSEMERKSLKVMFERSLESNLIYKYLISDGDCKGYNDVLLTYEVCKHCDSKREELSCKSGAAYKKWIETDDYTKWSKNHQRVGYSCNLVIKLDCSQHVSKNVAKKIQNKAKTGVRLRDGKKINTDRAGHRLNPCNRGKLIRQIRNAIKRNVHKNPQNQKQVDEGVQRMREALLAALHHSCDLPEGERHKVHNKKCLFASVASLPLLPHCLCCLFSHVGSLPVLPICYCYCFKCVAS